MLSVQRQPKQQVVFYSDCSNAVWRGHGRRLCERSMVFIRGMIITITILTYSHLVPCWVGATALSVSALSTYRDLLPFSPTLDCSPLPFRDIH